MTRSEAYQILTAYITDPKLLIHSLAAEVTMKALYKRLNPVYYDSIMEEKWGITGLLHDADYELTRDNPQFHGILLSQKEVNIPIDIAYAIKAHNYRENNIMPQSQMDWAMATCDQLTGLITACALVQPDKTLASVTPDFVLEKIQDNLFTPPVAREPILLCEEKLGIPLQEFIIIALLAIQSIHADLKL